MNNFDYPPIIMGEMLYSYLNRYFLFTGNNSYQRTISNLFGSSRKCYSIHYINDIQGALKNINMTLQEYIDKHTLLPLLKLVLPDEEYRNRINKIIFSKRSMHESLKKIDIFNVDVNKIGYCPMCILEHENQVVFFCYHQTIIDVCYKHNVKLNYYIRSNRRRDIVITNKDLDYHYYINYDIRSYYLARDIYSLISLANKVDSNVINELVKSKLVSLGMIKHNKYFSTNLVLGHNDYKHSVSCIVNLKKSKVNYIEYVMLIKDLFDSIDSLLDS